MNNAIRYFRELPIDLVMLYHLYVWIRW